jgi:4-hydroxybenzoate polyprenyltransferase
MIQRIRLVVVLARPAVVLLFGLFVAIGLAEAGHANDPVLSAKALAAVVAFLLFAVALNDLADQAVDRVNLADDRARPLVRRSATEREMLAIACVAGVVAVGVSMTLHPAAIVVVIAGLLLAAAYSLPPVRLAGRGAIASLTLPAGYVTVPYLLGIFAVRGTLQRADLVLLLGLYAGFIGRIVLKDFRDVRGDALFGKRTFLVRHGREATCAVSAACWVIGAATIFAVRGHTAMLAFVYTGFVAITLYLLRTLAHSSSARTDEALIAAIAITGRGVCVTLFAHFAMIGAGWPALAYDAVMLALLVQGVGASLRMAKVGPTTKLRVPTDLDPIPVTEDTTAVAPCS